MFKNSADERDARPDLADDRLDQEADRNAGQTIPNNIVNRSLLGLLDGLDPIDDELPEIIDSPPEPFEF